MEANLFEKYKNPNGQKGVPVFEEYVHKTSKLIKAQLDYKKIPVGKHYYTTFLMVRDWQEHKLIRRYNECINTTGNVPPDRLWWYLRKKDKATDK